MLLAALKQAQVTMLRRVDGEPARHGSVLFSQAHAALLQVLPALCRQARGLAAEALDVLLWPASAIDAGQVLARLQRWQAVAQLLASDGVRRATA